MEKGGDSAGKEERWIERVATSRYSPLIAHGSASNSLAELCQLVCATHMALHIPYLLLLIALALIDLPPRLVRAARRDDAIEQA